MTTSAPTTVRVHLLLDWDGTITTSDSLYLVARIGYKHRNREDLINGTSSEPEEPSTPLKPWKHLVQAYSDDMKEHDDNWPIPAGKRNTVQEELAYLASLEEVENRSVQRTEDTCLFKGVTVEEVDSAARTALESHELRVRDGWEKLIQQAWRTSPDAESRNLENVKMSVISVNWSRMFIESCLRQSTPAYPSAGSNLITIYANELEGLESTGVATGKLTKHSDRGIRTSADKGRYMPRRCMRRMRVRYAGKDGSSPVYMPDDGNHEQDNGDYLTVYIGDSATDLLCLLAADVGICIIGLDGTSSLTSMLDRIGVRTAPIGNWRDALLQAELHTRPLLTAKDFAEIAAWLEEVRKAPDVVTRLMSE